LVKFFAKTAVTKDIFTPETDEEIRIGEQVASYSIMLGDSISSGLSARWSKVRLRYSVRPVLTQTSLKGMRWPC